MKVYVGDNGTVNAGSNPKQAAAAAQGYNPNAYVPGGSSPKVSQAIQTAGSKGTSSSPTTSKPAAPPPPPPSTTSNPPTTDTSTNGYTPPPGDYSSLLGLYGLPPDIQAQVNEIFSKTGDPNEAATIALAWIRGTPWYKQTYPGIQQGISNGTVSNEASYRAYVNNIDQLYQQYYGRNPTSDEISGYLIAGYNPSYVGNLLQGQAWTKVNSPEVKYLTGAFTPNGGQMSQSDLNALGKEQAGIDSTAGQLAQKVYKKAQQIQARIQQGSLATPSLSLGATGLSSPSLAGGKVAPDVSAT